MIPHIQRTRPRVPITKVLHISLREVLAVLQASVRQAAVALDAITSAVTWSALPHQWRRISYTFSVRQLRFGAHSLSPGSAAKPATPINLLTTRYAPQPRGDAERAMWISAPRTRSRFTKIKDKRWLQTAAGGMAEVNFVKPPSVREVHWLHLYRRHHLKIRYVGAGRK